MGLVSVQAAKNSARPCTGRLGAAAERQGLRALGRPGLRKVCGLAGTGLPGGRVNGPVKKREGLQGSVYRYDTFLRLSLEIRTLCGG